MKCCILPDEHHKKPKIKSFLFSLVFYLGNVITLHLNKTEQKRGSSIFIKIELMVSCYNAENIYKCLKCTSKEKKEITTNAHHL